jgi:hypothetical protein
MEIHEHRIERAIVTLKTQNETVAEDKSAKSESIS